MICSWTNLVAVLPAWIRPDLNSIDKNQLQEIRLRKNAPPEFRLSNGSHLLQRKVTSEDLTFCINAASHYSPWSASTLTQGYITAPGGHRIGVCGEIIYHDGKIAGMKNISSICIRIAKDYWGISKEIPVGDSIIILGAPGWGKTTLLRDLIRRTSNQFHISVVDERGELFPQGFHRGTNTDVLHGCKKADGISILLRTMGPEYIAVDEITHEDDSSAILDAMGCGVRLLATAHTSSLQEFSNREAYRRLCKNNVFQTAVILHADKSWNLERMSK